MKRLFTLMLSLCMACMFSVSVAFADEDDGYTWSGDSSTCYESSGSLWIKGSGTLTLNGDLTYSKIFISGLGNEITITGDGSISGTISNSNATLTIESGTYTGTVSTSMKGSTTINGGTFSDKISLNGNSGATLTINGGTFSGAITDTSTKSTITINGGTFSGDITCVNATSTIIINGGSFADNSIASTNGTIIIYDGDFTNCALSKSSGTYSSLTIYHGTFTNTEYADYVSDETSVEVDEETVQVTFITVSVDDTTDEVHAVTNVEASEATCTEDGHVEYYACVYCDAIFILSDDVYSEVSEEDIVVSATGHTWNEGEVTTEATCTSEGVMVYTCTTCGETYEEVIEATGHDWDYDNPTIVWADDYSSLTVTWTCLNDSSHSYTEMTTNITSVTNDDGSTTYTATLDGPDPDNYTPSFDVTVEASTTVEADVSDDSVATNDSSNVYAWLISIIAAGMLLLGKGVITIKNI